MFGLLVIFTFSLLAMTLFGNIITSKEGTISAGTTNFRDFYSSIVFLFTCITGEGWNMVMYDTMGEVGYLACIFWVAFIIINVCIFLNIIVAVIFEKL